MEVIDKNIEELKPYKNNPRNNTGSVKWVKESIKRFGFLVPMIIDKNNVIVAGHTRRKAALELGMKTVPCVIAEDLTEEEVKALRLADNKVAEKSKWDNDKLFEEITDIINIDMENFGFDLDDISLMKDNERHRTNDVYNLDLLDFENSTNDFWQMPIIKNDNFIPNDMIGFNYAKTNEQKNVGVHFYLDDYQLERLWNKPESYVDILKQYDCILSPDFSLYLDMPMPMKIWNTYRSRQLGHYYQEQGIKVMPSISWAEKETFDFAFKGIPKGSMVSISTIGVKRNNKALKIWQDGVTAMIEEINPSYILIYGGKLDYDFGYIPVKYYENRVTEKFKKEV